MKKILKSRLFFFILGAVIFSTGTIFAYSILAPNVGFTPKDDTWDVDNVADALDYLSDGYKKMRYVGGGLKNTDKGTTYVNVTDYISVNPTLATVDNGVFTLKKDGKISVCTSCKGHGQDSNSNARLYHNSTLIYQLTQKNEIFRCDTIDVLKGDVINYQIASNNVKGMIWALGTISIYYIE